MLETVGSIPALAKQRIKFLGSLSLPAVVELQTVSGVTGCASRQSVSAAGGTPVGAAIYIADKTTHEFTRIPTLPGRQ